MAKKGEVKNHASNEVHQAAVAAYEERKEGRPKQFWDPDNRRWIKEES